MAVQYIDPIKYAQMRIAGVQVDLEALRVPVNHPVGVKIRAGGKATRRRWNGQKPVRPAPKSKRGAKKRAASR
jgi:hypothetical protein